MIQKKPKAKPAPTREADAGLTVTATSFAQVAASALMSAFTWNEHPWGEKFWQELHEELKRLDELSRYQ
jgi:hypothetical protein